MAQTIQSSVQLEWKINLPNESSDTLAPKELGVVKRAWEGLKERIEMFFVKKVLMFFKKAWDLGASDPRKVVHALKVGIALTLVSIVYFVRPLYEGFGGNAMWAVMTVVVVFENNVGASVCKSLNRICGTFVAGFLAIGVHYFSGKLGHKLEPFVMGSSVFLLASAATFSRFIPSIKARFDYGAMIFILTFSLVTVSGYRVNDLFHMAKQRVSTIVIGTSLCILISMLICPIWSGHELHALIVRNLEKLANSLDACTNEFFNKSLVDDDGGDYHEKLMGFKFILNSKAAEESMVQVNFARWEPAHGQFNYKHPWKQYLIVGGSTRRCAYSLDALKTCIHSKDQVSLSTTNHISNTCLRVSSNGSNVIRELAKMTKNVMKSSRMELLVEELRNSVGDLKDDLKSFPINEISVMDMIRVSTFVSLLIEIASRIENVVDAVKCLSVLAEFGLHDDEKSKPDHPNGNIN